MLSNAQGHPFILGLTPEPASFQHWATNARGAASREGGAAETEQGDDAVQSTESATPLKPATQPGEEASGLSSLTGPQLPTGSTERQAADGIAQAAKQSDAASQKVGAKDIAGGAHAVIDAALEKTPAAMSQQIARYVMSNLSGAFAAAESAVTAAVAKGSDATPLSAGVGDAPKVSGQLLNALCESIWSNPEIPVGRKMEVIFKLMAELLVEAQSVDSKYKNELNWPIALRDHVFSFPRAEAA